MKSSKGLIIVLVSIIIVLLVVIVLVFGGVISLNNKELNCGHSEVIESDVNDSYNSDSTDVGVNNTVIDNIEVEENDEIITEQDKLEVKVEYFDYESSIKRFDYNTIKTIFYNDIAIYLSADGNVSVGVDKISDVDNIVDILLFSKMNHNVLYMLDKNGDVYKYYVKINGYKVEKVENINNVDKIFIYSSGKANAGGCSSLIAIDKAGRYYRLNVTCV